MTACDDLVCVLDAAGRTKPRFSVSLRAECRRLRSPPGTRPGCDRSSCTQRRHDSHGTLRISRGGSRQQQIDAQIRRDRGHIGARARWRTWCSAHSADVPGVREQWGTDSIVVRQPGDGRIAVGGHAMHEDVRHLIGQCDVPNARDRKAGRPHGAVRGICRTRRRYSECASSSTLPPGEHGAFDLVDVLVGDNSRLLRKTRGTKR